MVQTRHLGKDPNIFPCCDCISLENSESNFIYMFFRIQMGRKVDIRKVIKCSPFLRGHLTDEVCYEFTGRGSD